MAKVRKAKVSELQQILQLEEELFSPPFAIEDLERELLDNKHSRFYVLEEKQDIIGFSILWILYDQAQIVQIGITKDKQNHGYGKMLMEKMISDAKQKECEIMSLEVRKSNTQAYEFYKLFDFKKATIRRAYYKNPTEDGYLLWRPLYE